MTREETRMRYILEGEWSGYVASQRHIVHREIVSSKRAMRLREMRGIRYTDGTMLILSLREAKTREQVKEIHGYDSLIREAEKAGGTFYVVGTANP